MKFKVLEFSDTELGPYNIPLPKDHGLDAMRYVQYNPGDIYQFSNPPENTGVTRQALEQWCFF